MPDDRERIISAESLGPEEEEFNWSLRPQRLAEVVGQPEIIERLAGMSSIRC